MHHKLAILHQNLLHGRLPRALPWTEVVELVGHLGQVQPQGGDAFAFVIGSEREVFTRPHTPECGIDEVSRLRRFLKQAAGEAPAGPLAQPALAEPALAQQPSRMVVVIDHHSAHIFHRTQHAGAPTHGDALRIEPYDPHHFHRHLVHRKEAHYQGDRVPEDTSFYEEVAGALAPASEIVLIGHAVGKSSAVAFLREYLQKHHVELARRITATEIADLSALTGAEVQALAVRHLTPMP